MPGKHVHFSRTNIVYAPPTPETPALSPSLTPYAPTSSHSSLSPSTSSSYSLPTPPDSCPAVLPPVVPSTYSKPFPSRPIMNGGPTRIHALLRFSPDPILTFDLRDSPSTVSSHHKVSRKTLYEPATTPPVPSLAITIPEFPWRVTVFPSDPSRVHVSVMDVLEELYHSLRMMITSRDFDALPGDKERRLVSEAYQKRYKRIEDKRDYEDEKKRGVVRGDFLMGRTKFLGLVPSTTGPGWVMQTT